MATSSRPIGVTTISLLGMLGGVLAVLIGLFIAILGAAFGALLGPVATVFGGFIGGFFIILGAIIFVSNWFLWKMKRIGWTLVIILESLGFLAAVLTLPASVISGIVGIVVNGLVIFYLYKSRSLFK